MSKKRYECIEDFEIELYIDDEQADEYFIVEKGSIWETDFKSTLGISDVYLTACNDNADFTWIEISYDILNECFKETENNG